MTDTTNPFEPRTQDSDEIVSAVETEGVEENLVVADITRDGAWVSMATEDTVLTREWR